MTRAPGVRPAWRRARAVLVSAVVAAPVALGGLVGPVGTAAAADPLLGVELTTLDPAIGGPGETLTAAGVLRVTGNQSLRSLQVRLRLSRTRLSSRGEMGPVARGSTESRDGDVVASVNLPGRATPGREVPFEVSVPLDDVEVLQEFGVHVLGVEVVGASRQGFGRLAIVRTFLPWVPADRDFAPTGFTWLWPLLSAPARLADGTFADDHLAGELASDGRLGRLTAAGARLGQQLPLTWMVDPALLDAATDMTDGYTVQAAGGAAPSAGVGVDAAAQWLTQLRGASALGTVVALPYGDPDLVALRRQGLTADLVASRARGAATAAALLDRPVTTDLAWPVEGFVDPATLRELRRLGVQSAVLDARALPPRLDLPFTPSGRADVRTPAGAATVLLTDPGMTEALSGRGYAQPLLAAQRFVAETAMVTAELPGTGSERTIVVVPPRHWAPSSELLDRVVGVSLRAPWMTPVSVEELRESPPAEIDRRRLRYPPGVRRAELPRPYLDGVRLLHDEVRTFTSVLSEPAELQPALDAAIFRLESSWWRGRQERLGWLIGSRRRVQDLTDQVQVLPGSYTFGSKSGTIPLTVSNDLTQAVTVDVSLVPSPPRLRIGSVEPVVIGAQSKVQVEVPATSVANGPVLVRTVLRTPTGEQYGAPVQLRVQVTQYGTVALFITGGAAAVLFLAAAVRLFRRATSARRAGHRAQAGPA